MASTENIYLTLKERLEKNVYPPESKFPSEYALAEEFGVSKVTANKIVSRLVEQGYLQRGVRGSGTRVLKRLFRPAGAIAFIGKLFPFSNKILKGVQQECLLNGYFPLLFSPEAEELNDCLHMLNPQNVAGIVSMGYGKIRSEWELPVICLDYSLPHRRFEDNICFIDSDDYSGGRQMMNEILRRGHREIAIFSSERYVFNPSAAVPPRIRGFHSALEDAGFRRLIERTFYGMPDSLPDARDCIMTIRKKYPKTSLICTDSDHSAELLDSVMKTMEIPFAKKIAITGFGNVSLLPIASVDQNPERQGRLAVQQILDFRRNPDKPYHPIVEPVETFLVRADHIPMRGH